MPDILLIEDDEALRTGLVYALGSDGFAVRTAGTLAAARRLLADEPPPGLILLDVLLPDGLGYDLCAEMKTRRLAQGLRPIPVIFLSACDSEISIVRGLDGGGDDYLVKPFRLRELISRIRAVLRRQAPEGPADEPADRQAGRQMRQVGRLRLDSERFRVWQDDREIELTALEFKLLHYLMSHSGQVLSRNQILAHLWDERGVFVDDNTLSVHIRHLREKIEQNPASPRLILTVRGVGYQMLEPE